MRNARTVFLIGEDGPISQGLIRALKCAFQIETYHFKDFSQDSFYEKVKEATDPVFIIIGDVSLSHEGEASLIEKIRINRKWENQIRRTPILFLTYHETLDLIRRDPKNILFLSEACKVIRMPFMLRELLDAINEIEPLSDFSRLKQFLLLEGRLAQIEQKDKHGSANLLGPLELLRGAYLVGEISQTEYINLVQGLERNLAKVDYYSEYLDLQASFVTHTEEISYSFESEKKVTLRDLVKDRGLRILLLDDEHEKGWSEVLKQILVPDATWTPVNGDILIRAEDPLTKTRLDCIARVGHSDDIGDLELAADILRLNDPETLVIDYDLILLDLRLKKESPKLPVDRTSGYLLLNRIRAKDPSIPVVMFTASERAYVLYTIQRGGIAGYFSKEFPRGYDEFSVANFEVLKLAITNATEKHYLRDIWFNTVLTKMILDSSGINREKYKLISSNLEGAYFKLASAHLRTSANINNYKETILLYHDCLDEYVTPPTLISKQGLGKRLNWLGSAESAGRKLNELRNQVVHGGISTDETDAIFAFFCIAYALLGDRASKICEFRISKPFKEALYRFYNKVHLKDDVGEWVKMRLYHLTTESLVEGETINVTVKKPINDKLRVIVDKSYDAIIPKKELPSGRSPNSYVQGSEIRARIKGFDQNKLRIELTAKLRDETEKGFRRSPKKKGGL